jgi:hypothetical protein
VVFGWLALYYIGFLPDAMKSGLVTDVYRLPYYLVYIVVALGMILAALDVLIPYRDRSETVFQEI